MKSLIQNGADVNVDDNDRKTPLHYSAHKGNLGCVNLLITAGADVHARSKNTGLQVIHDASVELASPTTVKALINAGASINSLTSFGGSPLSAAATRNKCDLGILCIQEGADINHMDNDGDSVLFETLDH